MGLSEYASGSWVGGGWVRSMDTYKYVHVDVDTRTMSRALGICAVIKCNEL